MKPIRYHTALMFKNCIIIHLQAFGPSLFYVQLGLTAVGKLNPFYYVGTQFSVLSLWKKK